MSARRTRARRRGWPEHRPLGDSVVEDRLAHHRRPVCTQPVESLLVGHQLLRGVRFPGKPNLDEALASFRTVNTIAPPPG